MAEPAIKRIFYFSPGGGDDPDNGEKPTSLLIRMSVGEAASMMEKLFAAVRKADKDGDAVQVRFDGGSGEWIKFTKKART